MTKLAYTNDQQIINDAADLLVKEHLGWSSSHEGMPSRDLSGVAGHVLEAYLKGNYTEDEWDQMGSESKKLAKAKANSLYKQAAQIADKKWEAVMALLGF